MKKIERRFNSAYNFLKKNGKCGAEEIWKHILKSRSSVYRELKTLVKFGMVEKIVIRDDGSLKVRIFYNYKKK